MRRSPVLVAALAAVLACAAPPAGAAATRTVDPVAGPYTTITDALHAADPGDTIDIHEGHYDEQLWVDKDDLTLRAAPGTIVSSTAPFVISLMGAGDTLQGLYVAGGPGGVRIEGAGARLIDTTVLAGATAVSVKGGIQTTLLRAFLRATDLTGTALLARNDATGQQGTTLTTSLVVGGRMGTGIDVLTGAVGDTTRTGLASVTTVFSTVAGAPTAVTAGRDGMGGLVVVTGAASIVHGAAPALIAVQSDTTTPDAQTFVNVAALDFHLVPSAPAIDTIAGPLAGDEAIDFDGRTRPLGAAADQGAFELVPLPPAAPPTTSVPTPAPPASTTPDAADPTLRFTTPRPGAHLHRYRTIRRRGHRARRVVNVLRFAGRATAAADAGGLARVELTLAQRRTKAIKKPIALTVRATLASGGAWSWRTSSRTALPAGSYTLTARALDRAGNTSAPGVLHFTVT